MKKILSVLTLVASLIYGTPAHADALALMPSVAVVAGAAVTATSAPLVVLPVTAFYYLTFNSKEKPFEELFPSVEYSYPTDSRRNI